MSAILDQINEHLLLAERRGSTSGPFKPLRFRRGITLSFQAGLDQASVPKENLDTLISYKKVEVALLKRGSLAYVRSFNLKASRYWESLGGVDRQAVIYYFPLKPRYLKALSEFIQVLLEDNDFIGSDDSEEESLY